MFLEYKSKKSEKDILTNTKKAKLEIVSSVGGQTPNLIVQGDNLEVMKALQDEKSISKKIDLVYIDPPFATNTIFKAGKIRVSTISSRDEDDVAYTDTLQGEYFIEFLRERLILIRELMSDNSSIYLHIDYKIGHYVKVMMDEIFGIKNFRNDITRVKCNPKNFTRNGYGNVKDLILFYTKGKNFIWNEPKKAASEEAIARLFSKIDKNGRRYTTNPLHAPGETKNGNSGKIWKGMTPPAGRHWRYSTIVLDELEKEGLIEWSSKGNPRKIVYADDHSHHKLQDIWEFKDTQTPTYPTEKNIDLLKTIIEASSNKGSLVFDAFCGSGTTLVAAEELGRNWIGLDSSNIAIETTQKRLGKVKGDLFNTGPSYIVKKQI